MAARVFARSDTLEDNVDDFAECFLIPEAVPGQEGFGHDREHRSQERLPLDSYTLETGIVSLVS